MKEKQIRGNYLYINRTAEMSCERIKTEFEEKTRLVVEEDTIYEIDINCENCKERDWW